MNLEDGIERLATHNRKGERFGFTSDDIELVRLLEIRYAKQLIGKRSSIHPFSIPALPDVLLLGVPEKKAQGEAAQQEEAAEDGEEAA